MAFFGLVKSGKGAVNKAAQQASAAQAGRAQNQVALVNQAFDDPAREAGRQDFLGAMRAQRADATNRGFTDTARRNKFSTARRGLTGGQVDVDTQRRTLEDLFRARAGDESASLDAYEDLRAGDEAQRQALIRQAYGIADTGAGAISGMLGQQSRNATALSNTLPNAFQNATGDLAGAFARRSQNQAYLDAWRGAAGGGL